MKVKTSYKACDYITAGKEYEVEEDYGSDWGIIVDDFGSRIVITLHSNCDRHLDITGSWEIIE